MDRERQRQPGHDRLRRERHERRGELHLTSESAYSPDSTLGDLPRLGLGIGLRSSHFGHITSEWPAVDWFEAISENFMDSGGRPGWVIRRIAERYPVALHGVSLSIGSTEPIDRGYLSRLKRLADEIRAVWVSDHLCWTGVVGVNSHDLLPLPLNEHTLRHVAGRVRHVQEVLERPLILENPSTYIGFQDTTLDEPSFLTALAEETGCGLLLDVNNVYVTCFNAGIDPLAYLEAFPFEHVVQLHLAGHQHCGTHIVDTHDQPVCDAVWELFRFAWQRTAGASTLLEWDGDVPHFNRVYEEVQRARAFMHGPVDVERLRSEPGEERDTISNPVDFLVPEVMGSARLEGE
jgi:uncharacterized protein (UPF0276 family)